MIAQQREKIDGERDVRANPGVPLRRQPNGGILQSKAENGMHAEMLAALKACHVGSGHLLDVGYTVRARQIVR